MFQSHQAVKVVDETLELFGQAGAVVELDNGKGEVGVQMDVDGVVWHFQPAQIRGL